MRPPCDAGCGRPAEYVLDLDPLPAPLRVCSEHLEELRERAESGG
jgi:hypothetical protein